MNYRKLTIEEFGVLNACYDLISEIKEEGKFIVLDVEQFFYSGPEPILKFRVGFEGEDSVVSEDIRDIYRALVRRLG